MAKRGAPIGLRAGASAALVAAALMVGCGGGDDAPIEPISTSETTSTAGTLTQDDFILSADARCSEANAAIANLSTDSDATAIQQELDITQGLLEGLQGLGEAEDPAGSLDAYYSALDDQVLILQQQVTAVEEGDTTTVGSLETELDAAKSAASEAATQYGFEDCGGSATALPDDGETPSADPGVPATPTPTTPVPVTPVPTTPVPAPPVTPPAPVDPGDGGGTPPTPPAPTPPDDGGGGSSGGVGVG